ncbi:hypothetical protein DAMA08_042050 [Martiniozyma asiatica (nom. inval.)]|nr:hypothetical protein DAMA08_042050 [Martiniozyma asiatica]
MSAPLADLLNPPEEKTNFIPVPSGNELFQQQQAQQVQQLQQQQQQQLPIQQPLHDESVPSETAVKVEQEPEVDVFTLLKSIPSIYPETDKKRKNIKESVEYGANGKFCLDDENRKRKRTKKQEEAAITTELPLRLCVADIEAQLNSDKKIAKNAARRSKNKFMAELIFDIIRYKQGQVRDKRRKEGNWKYLMSEGYDLNCFLETQEENYDEDSKRHKYGNWAEFKTTMYKSMTRSINATNARMANDAILTEQTPTKVAAFLDDAFKQL